jgi:hypothetical protein
MGCIERSEKNNSSIFEEISNNRSKIIKSKNINNNKRIIRISSEYNPT